MKHFVPRKFKHRIGALTIIAAPKCSSRSVEDFVKAVKEQTRVQWVKPCTIVVFRNPLNRLVSGYLNKYVEHAKYRDAVGCDVGTFERFVHELHRNGLRRIDRLHFEPQTIHCGGVCPDWVTDAERLDALRDYVNQLFGTRVPMGRRVNDAVWLRNQTEAYDGDQHPAKLTTGELRALISDRRLPLYRRFYTDDLRRTVRDIYKADFAYQRKHKRKRI